MHNYYVYIMTNKPCGVLYVGVTSNLGKRVYEHKNNITPGFTSKYKLYNLVYYDYTENVHAAIAHEKRLKKWNRQWKIELVTKFNPKWEDLYYKIVG